MAIPKSASTNNFAQRKAQMVKKKRPLITPESTEVDVTAKDYLPQRKESFAQSHVRWTGYLTKDNDARLRALLSQHRIPSLTRFINEAVEESLKRKFSHRPDESA